MYKNIGKLHHIGLATEHLAETTALYGKMGYEIGNVLDDPAQHVKVCFLTHPFNPTIEVIISAEKSSPIRTLLQKNGTCLYHLCYETENIDAAVQELRKDGYLPVSKEKTSVISGGGKSHVSLSFRNVSYRTC